MDREKTLRNTLVTFFVLAFFGGLFFGYILSEVNQGKELQKLSSYQPTTPTKLYDTNGVLFAELYRHKQELLKFKDIPPHVVQAFLSVEDDNFYNHVGIDFLAIVRAGIKNILAGRIVQGGSTLTQQLAKTVLQERKKTFARKFLEALLTLQIEQEYTKEEILEIYFNLIYLGHGTTGLSSAANVYFQKDVRDLDIAEGALLARLPKAPVDYSPYKNPAEAKVAHKLVLTLMARNGFLDENRIQPIHDAFWEHYWPIVITQSPSRSAWGAKLNRAPHFTEWVRGSLLRQLQEQYGEQLGEEILYTGGLRVYTTLDINKQEIAEEELRKGLIEQDRYAFGANVRYAGRADKSLVSLYNLIGSVFPVGVPEITNLDDRQLYRLSIEKEMIPALELLTTFVPSTNPNAAVKEFRRSSLVFSSNLHVEGAIVTIDHQNGYVQTMVGGSRFTPKNQFNRAMQARRQTGSAFKPFVYGAGIQNRAVGSGTGIMDAPLTTLTEEGEGYSPQDMSGDFRGMVPLSRALGLSLNIVSVQVLMRTGADAVIDFSSRLTKVDRSRFPTGPALALGVAELTPFEMALGYSIIANRGKDVIPFTVRYVLDQSGNVLLNREKEVQEEIVRKTKDGSIQIIPEATAYIVKQMLIGVATGGTPTATLRAADKGNYKGESGGKTGSTSSYTNVWYCGFDPKYTSVVWMGFDKSSLSLGQGTTAAGVAVPIWGKMYSRWYNEGPYPSFKTGGKEDAVPEGVVKGASCSFNGLAPGPTCPLISNMYLQPLSVAGKQISIPATRQCDGDRDHFRSMDLKDFLQRELEISDDDLKQP